MGTALPRLTDEEIAEFQRQAEADAQLHIDNIRDVELRHGEVIRATVAELMRAGNATLQTTAGPIEARIIRFPRGAVVLEIDHPGGSGQSRTTEASVGEQAVHQLAHALVSTGPKAEPLP
jgi:hypothetical protein